MRRSKLLIVLGVAVLALSACSSGGSDASGDGDSNDDAATSTGVVAAAPLIEGAMKYVVGAYNAENPAEPVALSTQQYNQIGATIRNKSADVVAAPNVWLDPVKGSLSSTPFGNSQSVIVVSTANPKNITSTKAFAAGSGLRTRVCALNSVYGNFGVIALKIGGVTPAPSTVGSGCEAEAAQQVAAGTLDAALVFRNGFTVPAGTKLITVPKDENLVIDFSYVVPGTSAQAKRLAEFMASPRAQEILTASGFLP